MARNAETNAVETHQKLMTREEVWKYLLETYTREGDIVFHDVVKQGECSKIDLCHFTSKNVDYLSLGKRCL